MKRLLPACFSTILLTSFILVSGTQAKEQKKEVLKQQSALEDSTENLKPGFAPPVQANPPAVELMLQDAIRYSLEGNQDIHIVSYTPKQAREEVIKAESAYDPSVFAEGSYNRQPDLQSSVDSVVMEDVGIVQTGVRQPLTTGGSVSAYLETRYEKFVNSGTGRSFSNIFAPTVELKQPLLKNVGGRKEKTAIRIAQLQTSISEQEFRQKVLEITSNVSQAYWQVYLYHQLVNIDQENVEMAREVRRRESIRASHGLSQPTDAERSRSNEQSRRNALLLSKKRLQMATEKLKLLMNNPALALNSRIGILPVEQPKLEPVAVDEDKIVEAALVERPELKNAERQLEVRKAEEELYAHQRLPKLDLFGRYSFSGYGGSFRGAVDDVSINKDDYWAVGLSLEIPIGNRAANAAHRQKVLGGKQAGAQIESVRDKVKLDVQQVIFALRSAGEEIESTRQAMKSAERLVSGEFARYDIGQTTNDEILRSQDLMASASRSFVNAIVDYNIALAELARVQGTLPYGISLEGVKK